MCSNCAGDYENPEPQTQEEIEREVSERAIRLLLVAIADWDRELTRLLYGGHSNG